MEPLQSLQATTYGKTGSWHNSREVQANPGMGCETPLLSAESTTGVLQDLRGRSANQINSLALVLGRCNLPSSTYWTSEHQHGGQMLTEGVPSLPNGPMQG